MRPRPRRASCAHARELAIGRLQQQVTFDRHQVETLGATAAEIEAEVAALEARREPARIELEERRDAPPRSIAERDQAAADLAAEENTYADLQVRIEGLEGDVEAARSEVFAAVNAATALRHAVEHAAAARSRIGEQIGKLDVEGRDLRIEAERAAQERAAAEAGLRAPARRWTSARRARRPRVRAGGAAPAREAAPASSAREQEVAGIAARLRSLEELDAARAEYGDGPAPGPRGIEWRRRPDGVGGRLPRGRRRLRAGRRSLSRRSAAARRRPHARGSGGRTALRIGAECRPRRFPGGRGSAEFAPGLAVDGPADGVARRPARPGPAERAIAPASPARGSPRSPDCARRRGAAC